MAATPEKNFVRRDHLVSHEGAVRDAWKSSHVFEKDASDSKDATGKYMVTFPYPYMNGVLHLGHAFSLSKAEFMIRFQRLLGKNTLFPFGFHCTGMPIAACADKLKDEIATYGCPPQFPKEEEANEEADDKTEELPETGEKAAAPEGDNAGASAVKPARKKKAKLAGKKSALTRQWDIMLESGVPDELIPNFQDANYWLSYFPPIAMNDLDLFGLATDWRRSFITTDVNPYYDAFIQWQMRQLLAKGKIAFGKRMCIYSPREMQACADHDRAVGETVGPQAYTLIKLRLVKPFPAKVVELLSASGLTIREDVNAAAEQNHVDVYLPAATLRPETMYGQTNLFILPEGTYDVYRRSQTEVFVCTERSALNMAHQFLFETVDGVDIEFGNPSPRHLGQIKGQDVIGSPVFAPNSPYEKVYVLPLTTISMDIGTGIVTSVPSDAPHDYAALMDLKNKPAFREKFGVTDEMVLPFDIVPIINIPEIGDRGAETLCVEAKVASQNDEAKLSVIKDKMYLLGFNKGVMIVGEFKDMPVSQAKVLAKERMIAQGTALDYSEPESKVVSRSGATCVAALVDQWYIKYGEESWVDQCLKHVDSENFNPFSAPIHSRLRITICWLKDWACSRSYGLGTRMPGAPEYVIESLSDSTIYMAYYTIAHILQGGILDGSGGESRAVPSSKLTDAVFDYVFLEKEFPADCGIDKAVLDKMRAEFEYWYPFDLRVSGKDLLNNHLVMSLYTHAAIWDGRSDRMPGGIYANGLLLLDGEKMSKSTGKFLTIRKAIELYGADATRFTLASAGDSLDDANFVTDTADKIILRLFKEEQWAQEVIEQIQAGSLRKGELTFWDKFLENEINAAVSQTRANYEAMRLLDVCRTACHNFCNVRDVYRTSCSEIGIALHEDVVKRWLDAFIIMLSPICPFWTQNVWSNILGYSPANGKPEFVCDARFPEGGDFDSVLDRKVQYLRATASNIVKAKTNALLARKKKSPTDNTPYTKLTIRVATSYLPWQQQVLKTLQEVVDASEEKEGNNQLADNRVVNEKIRSLFAEDKKTFQAAMKFTATAREEYKTLGAEALELSMPFSEAEVLREHVNLLVRNVDIDRDNVTVEQVEADAPSGPGCPKPAKPQFLYE